MLYICTIMCFRLCNIMGSEIYQPSSDAEEQMVLNVLRTRPRYSQPVMPGYYHIGLYQKQSAKLYYLRNGIKV